MSNNNWTHEDWNEMVTQMNEAVADSIEQNMEAQAAFMESWSDQLEESVPDEDVVAQGMEGYSSAYETWMNAAEQVYERSIDAAEGEDVDPSEYRDIWLEAANNAFKEVMSTEAFAAANGQFVQMVMEMRQEFDEAQQEAIAGMGLPSREDVEEVGERLVELERRQHDVETKLDRILDELEE
ncbi:poly(R)-hydroxyalkanoic acid synthase subunit PhaE [Halovenus marina]|uniref:poly(R)-hydroxyalkanoic acid synthase subunit PhaE n=1 Tax=Halovenus marina TaxID=3396621 RepID=UPI003F55B653